MLTIKSVTQRENVVHSFAEFFEAVVEFDQTWEIKLGDAESEFLSSEEASSKVKGLIFEYLKGSRLVTTKQGHEIALVGNYEDTRGAQVHLVKDMEFGTVFNAAGELCPTMTYFNKAGEKGRTLYCNNFNPVTGDTVRDFNEANDAPALCRQGDGWVHQNFDGDVENTSGKVSLIGRVSSFEELLMLIHKY